MRILPFTSTLNEKYIESLFTSGATLLNAVNPGRKNRVLYAYQLTGRSQPRLLSQAIQHIRGFFWRGNHESNACSFVRIYPQHTMLFSLGSVLSAALHMNTLKRFEPAHQVRGVPQMWPNLHSRDFMPNLQDTYKRSSLT